MGTSGMQNSALSRRRFLGGAAGLTFAVGLGPGGRWLVADASANPANAEIGAWVRIAADELITIITPAAEMGQGSMTGVPIALAEELDADWSKVSLEMAPAVAETYGYGEPGRKRMMIVGSRAVRSYFEPMRRAGAQVRKFLIQTAAEEWRVDAATLVTEPGEVVDPANGRRLTYGEIASIATVPHELPPVEDADLKRPREFRLIGKPVPRWDIPEKVDGAAQFSMDVILPGMVYASTVHAPVQLAKPARWNDKAVRSLPGVIHTRRSRIRRRHCRGHLRTSPGRKAGARRRMGATVQRRKALTPKPRSITTTPKSSGVTMRHKSSSGPATAARCSTARRKPSAPNTAVTTATTRRWNL